MSAKKLSIITAVVLTAFFISYYWTHPLTEKATINEHVLYLDLAVTAAEKEKGLGYRDSLARDHGMLFIYDHKELYPFWMKGMLFPLDFIWIDDKTVVDITTHVPPPSSAQLPIYHPRVPVDKILEVNAGVVDELGTKVGDTVKFSN